MQYCKYENLLLIITRMWPMPNAIAILPNIGGALCCVQRRKVWLTRITRARVPYSNAIFLSVHNRRRIPCRYSLITRSFITCLHNKWHLDPQPFGHNTHGPKIGGFAPASLFGVGGSPSNTKSPGPRPTSTPSGILVHPAVWVQRTWVDNWGCVCRGGRS